MFENAIQACADLAQHVATTEFGYSGDAAKEAISRRIEEDVIDAETGETLIAAVGFRNVLAHQYGTIEYAKVYEMLQEGLAVYDDFSQQIAQWYRRRR